MTLDCEYIQYYRFTRQLLTVSRGVAEHSHRSQYATDILNTMKADLTSFLEIPPTHEILIMQGDSISLRLSTIWLTIEKVEDLENLTRLYTIRSRSGLRSRDSNFCKVGQARMKRLRSYKRRSRSSVSTTSSPDLGR